MEQSELNQHQRMAVEALKEIKRICEEHQIRYYLIAGSLLGAVRNGGMILWDDDIDLGFLYEDWLKIKKILPMELDERFTYADPDIDPTFPRLFPKVLFQHKGCVDLFPIVKWTNSRFKSILCIVRVKAARAFFNASIGYIPVEPANLWGSVKKMILHTLIAFGKVFRLKHAYFIGRCRKIERTFQNERSDWYLTMYGFHPVKNEMLRREWIEKQSTVLFEGEEFTCFGDPKAFLAHMYGSDFMTPRQTHQHTERF